MDKRILIVAGLLSLSLTACDYKEKFTFGSEKNKQVVVEQSTKISTPEEVPFYKRPFTSSEKPTPSITQPIQPTPPVSTVACVVDDAIPLCKSYASRTGLVLDKNLKSFPFGVKIGDEQIKNGPEPSLVYRVLPDGKLERG